MNWGKALRAVGAVAVTAAASAVNPALGAALGSSLASGAAVKVGGKALEKRGGPPVHRIASPVAAVAAPFALTLFGVDLQPVCDLTMQLCSGASTPIVLGGAAVVVHQVLRGLTTALSSRA